MYICIFIGSRLCRRLLHRMLDHQTTLRCVLAVLACLLCLPVELACGVCLSELTPWQEHILDYCAYVAVSGWWRQKISEFVCRGELPISACVFQHPWVSWEIHRKRKYVIWDRDLNGMRDVRICSASSTASVPTLSALIPLIGTHFRLLCMCWCLRYSSFSDS